jgi:cation diffusion facilitator CzcD-associated flavoprotein CzcO
MGDQGQADEIHPISAETELPERSVSINGDQKPATPSQERNGISPHYPQVSFQLEDRYIDEPRSLRVVVIGAGLAGINAGILFPIKGPGIQLTIFEKNLDVAGTWYENKYPGVQCDIPSLVYQSTFSPNTKWSEKFARGPEIRDYWQSVARKYDVYRYVKLGHKVEEAVWDPDTSIWRLSIKDIKNGTHFSYEADVLLTAIGRFNAWKIPQFPGIERYKGLLRHASNWDPSFDLSEKTVAVIGNGASGIQLTANLQKRVKRLDHYARNRTWIAASWAGDERTLEPLPFSDTEKVAFDDPQQYVRLRKQVEDKYWRRFSAFFRGSKDNDDLRDRFIQIMKKRLAKKPELFERLVPDFSPNCRRLTPGMLLFGLNLFYFSNTCRRPWLSRGIDGGQRRAYSKSHQEFHRDRH